MSLPRYPKYRDSDVEWLDEIPTEWTVRRIKSLFEIKKRIAGEDGHDVLSITQKGIRIKDIESNDGQLSMDYSKYQLVEPGDFAMNHMDLLTGYVDVSSVFGVTSPDYRVFALRNRATCCDRFFLYLFQNAYTLRIFYAFGQGASQLGRWRLPTEQFHDFALPYPSLDEQSAIADFLDRETAKIDALVEEQQRLIELLKEKRQAVISHAVTKGVNPDAQSKASGNRWIGSVPSNWSLSRVKYEVSAIVDCLHTTPTYDGEVVYPSIRTADLEPGRVLLDQARLVSEEVYTERIQRLEPAVGDILYSREGRVGIAAPVPPNTKLCLGQRMMMFRPNPKHDSRYLMWTMNSSAVYQQVLEKVAGPTAPHVNIEDVVNFVIPVPERAEQEAIARHLDSAIDQIDAVVLTAKRGIDLLQERRTALISAAVTGKIDVRGMAKGQSA
jgi:type I restriction enzyme S subunit